MSEEFLPATDDQDATPAPPDPSSMGTPTSVPATATDAVVEPTSAVPGDVNATVPATDDQTTAGAVDADTSVTVTQPIPASGLPTDTSVTPTDASGAPLTTSPVPVQILAPDTPVLPTGPVRAGDLPPDTLVTVYQSTDPTAAVSPGAPSSAGSSSSTLTGTSSTTTDSSVTVPSDVPPAATSSPTAEVPVTTEVPVPTAEPIAPTTPVPAITEPVASSPTVDTSAPGVSVHDPISVAYGPNTNVKEVQVELGQTLQQIADDAKVAAIQVYQANAPEIERVARDELGLVVSFAGRFIKAGTKLLVPDHGDQ